MTQVTVRRIDEAWVAKAKAEAKRRDVSMNTILVEAIARGLGVDQKKKTNGLERFSGTMPPDPQFETFLNEDLMEIHPDDWK